MMVLHTPMTPLMMVCRTVPTALTMTIRQSPSARKAPAIWGCVSLLFCVLTKVASGLGAQLTQETTAPIVSLDVECGVWGCRFPIRNCFECLRQSVFFRLVVAEKSLQEMDGLN